MDDQPHKTADSDRPYKLRYVIETGEWASPAEHMHCYIRLHYMIRNRLSYTQKHSKLRILQYP